MDRRNEQAPARPEALQELEISLDLELERLGELQRDLHDTSFAIQRELARPRADSDRHAVANLLRLHQLQVDNLTEMSERMAAVEDIQRDLEELGGPSRAVRSATVRPDHADWYQRGTTTVESQSRSMDDPSDSRTR